jgi:hypothetical protein
VSVIFSDGREPTVQATDVLVDKVRGMVMTRVPAGAATGNMKISAGGLDSAPYFFRVAAEPFVQGTNVLEGRVTRQSDGSAVGGVMFILMRDSGCESDVLIDFAQTDDTGHYTMHGTSGDAIFVPFAPSGSGLAGTAVMARLPAPTPQDFALSAGAVVSGKVVDATTSASVPRTPIGLDFSTFDTFSHEEAVSGENGNFSVTLRPGG